VPKPLPGFGFSADHVASDLVLVEDPPDGREELRTFSRKWRMILRCVGDCDQLFANQVISRTLCAEASLDRLRRSALFDLDLLEPHRGNIA
jgi:hypothetical protein